MTITLDSGTCTTKTSLEKLMKTVENACCEPLGTYNAQFVLIESDTEIYKFSACEYSYTNDYFALKRHIECEIDANDFAVVLELREGIPAWIWIVD